MKLTVKKFGMVFLALVILLNFPVTVVSAKKHTLGNTVANQMLPGASAEYKGHIYYGIPQDGTIYSIKKDGTDKRKIYTLKNASEANGFLQLAVYNGYIYGIFDFYCGTSGSVTKLVRVKTDGSGYKDYGYALTVAVADGKIYYTKAKTSGSDLLEDVESIGIYSMNLDGSGKKALVKKKDVSVIAVDGKNIYYAVPDYKIYKTVIYRCSMTGKNKKKILGVSFGFNNFFYVDGNDSFYVEDNAIICFNMKTRKKTKVYTAKYSISGCFIEGNILYVSSGDELKKVNLATKKEIVLARGKNIDLEAIYNNVIIYSKYKDGEFSIKRFLVLSKKSSGKTIKKLGEYFRS